MCLYGNVVLNVVTFEETEFVVHVQSLETMDVVVHRARVHAYGHQRAVGRNHYAVGGGVLEFEVRHPEGVVFVVLCVVEFVVGRFGDTPRQFALSRVAHKGALGEDSEAVGLVHQGMPVGWQEDKRHKVFEQCAVPRRHAFIAFVLDKGFVETEPVFVGGVALGDGEERGKTCLRCEIVVVVGQKLVVTAVVADAEHVEFGVVELHKIGLRYQTFYLCQHFQTPTSGFRTIQKSLHHIEAGHEIAAVAGAYKEIWQGFERAHIVPVVQVSVPFFELAHGVGYVFQLFHGIFVGDETQLRGAHHGGHGVADIGGRGLVVGFVFAV